ncbi:MAG: host attachment protein [Hyphomonas sp.]
MHLKHGDRVIVCDGGKYVVYDNHGDTGRIDLRVVRFEEDDVPPTRDLGSGPPGRYPGPGSRRSAVDQTDWHDQAEADFIHALGERIEAWAAAEPGRTMVLIADPRSMGRLRKVIAEHAQARIGHTITGNFVRRPVAAIEDLINEA